MVVRCEIKHRLESSVFGLDLWSRLGREDWAVVASIWEKDSIYQFDLICPKIERGRVVSNDLKGRYKELTIFPVSLAMEWALIPINS